MINDLTSIDGGILATTNKGIGLATYCSGLDIKGNSVSGIKMLEYLSNDLDLGIY